MPELAEVEFYRRRWDAGMGQPVIAVRIHPRARDFRGADPRALVRALVGQHLTGSEARGKQMLIRFGEAAWLGIHLGMTGRLRVDAGLRGSVRPGRRRGGRTRGNSVAPSQEPTRHIPAEDARHDHLVLEQPVQRLVFSDPRMFGRIRFDAGVEPPPWWRALPPSVLDPAFDVAALGAFLRRRARAPLKGVLLLQERFPGVGNWMADEILWRAGLHPSRPAGSLHAGELGRLWREVRFVARGALRSIAHDGRQLPRGWLFHQRWTDGGLCPRSGVLLVRETIGGRTTCWSPAVQSPQPAPPARRTGRSAPEAPTEGPVKNAKRSPTVRPVKNAKRIPTVRTVKNARKVRTVSRAAGSGRSPR